LKTPNFVTVLSGVALATSGIVFGLCLPSNAAQLWNWSFNEDSNSYAGTFTTDDGPSPYAITGLTGDIIFAPSPDSNRESGTPAYFLGYDELEDSLGFFAYSDESTFWLDPKYIQSPEGLVLAYSDEPGDVFANRLEITPVSPPTPTSTSTPEPSSLLSFITLGGLMLGGAVRGARK